MALNIFPRDVAEELRSYAEKASSHCAKARFGKKGEADAAKVEAEQHYGQFKEKSEGLLSDDSCANIKWMLWNEAWYTANTRKGYKDDAEKDKQNIEEHFQKVIKIGEVSKTLLTDVKWMGWNAAWFAANTIVGYNDDAVRDKAKVEAHFSKMHGDVKLVAMNFFTDQAKILTDKPKIVAEQTMINNGSIQQTMAFTFSVTEGRTSSTSHNIGFSYGITTGLTAGFKGLAEVKFETSFNFSYDLTFSQSISTGITKTYEFQLSVPKDTTYVAKGMVHEAEMEVPYELVFDFDGVQRSVRGIWKGVAVSKATYQIDEK